MKTLNYNITTTGTTNDFLAATVGKIETIIDGLDCSEGLIADLWAEDTDGGRETIDHVIWDILGRELSDVEFDTAVDCVGIELTGIS